MTWPPKENCYCGGPEEIYPHRHGTGRHCRTSTPTGEVTAEVGIEADD